MKPTSHFAYYVAEAYSPEVAAEFEAEVGKRDFLSYSEAMAALDRVLGGGIHRPPVFRRTGSFPPRPDVPAVVSKALEEAEKKMASK